MNYEERTNRIGTLLREAILPRYTRPAHMDDGTARAELADMVEDMNRQWPIMSPDRFDLVGREMARHLRRDYAGRQWPPIKAMLSALKAACSEPVEGVDAAEPCDDYALMADRIREGRPIGEDWFFGPRAKELVRRGLATELHLETYRSGLFFAMCDAYGEDRARRMIAQRRAEHEAAPFPTSEEDLARARSARGRQMPREGAA